MFKPLLYLVLAAGQCYTTSVRLPDKLRVKEFTLERNETHSTSSLKYESPEAAKVVWVSREIQYGDREEFVLGNGESTISVEHGSAQAAVFLPGGNDLTSIGASDEGQYDVPDTKLLCSAGDEIVYTPGVPLDINITWTNLPSSMIPESRTLQHMNWVFVGRKPSVSDNLIAWSKDGPGGPQSPGGPNNVESVGDIISESTSEDYHRMHTKFNFQDESGLLVFATYYYLTSTLNIQRAKMVTVHQEGHDVFPQDFIVVPDLNSRSASCEIGGSCFLECIAFGHRITSLVVQDGNGNEWQPAVSYNNEWTYAGLFRFPLADDQGGYNVSCVATNDNNQSAELVYTVRIYY